MKSTFYKLEITLLTELLGTKPGDPEVTERFLRSKAEEAGQDGSDIMETVPELQKGTTGFDMQKFPDGTSRRVYVAYMLKGFFKEAASFMNGKVLEHGKTVKNFRSKIDNNVFIGPRYIPLMYQGEVAYCERPLRATTAQGPRVTLARSEQLPDATTLSCYLKVFDGEITENHLRELLNYGQDKGLGQWRNGGYGQFSYVLTKIDDPTFVLPR